MTITTARAADEVRKPESEEAMGKSMREILRWAAGGMRAPKFHFELRSPRAGAAFEFLVTAHGELAMEAWTVSSKIPAQPEDFVTLHYGIELVHDVRDAYAKFLKRIEKTEDGDRIAPVIGPLAHVFLCGALAGVHEWYQENRPTRFANATKQNDLYHMVGREFGRRMMDFARMQRDGRLHERQGVQTLAGPHVVLVSIPTEPSSPGEATLNEAILQALIDSKDPKTGRA